MKKQNKAIKLEDLIPIVGEGTVLYRKFKYKSTRDEVVQEYKRCFGVAVVSLYQAWIGLTFATNYFYHFSNTFR